MRDAVIVGGSLAGLRAAESLRSAGYEGAVTIVGDEPHLPYDRPPLSKRLLSGEWEPDRIVLRKPDDLGAIDVRWRRGARATALDLDGSAVVLDGGERVGFDGLVIATGATARRLPGQDEHGHVVVLRTLDDALDLRGRLAGGGGNSRGRDALLRGDCGGHRATHRRPCGRAGQRCESHADRGALPSRDRCRRAAHRLRRRAGSEGVAPPP